MQVKTIQTDQEKTEVEDMFDNIAPKYDLLNHVLSMKIDVLEKYFSKMDE